MPYALDIVIGLAAVYTAFSLLASWLNETINGITGLRASTLRDGIARMVGDASLHSKLYGQPSIQAAQSNDERGPSYLSAKQFSMAVMGMLNAAGAIGQTGQAAFSAVAASVSALPPSRLKDALNALLVQSDAEIGSFVSGVENWFDSEMDRVTGWYKRNAQIWLIVIGLVLAAAFDVDSVRLGYNFVSTPLVMDCNLQADVVSAQQCVSAAVFSRVTIGWQNTAYCRGNAQERAVACADLPPSFSWTWLLLKIAGIVLTGIAVSLGAPFWFDSLSRFVNVRNAGPQPSKQTDN